MDNSNTKKNLHKGHRDRVRERFLSEGLESFQAHNVLEMLLFYSIKQSDTNEIAHRLEDHFGTLAKVLDAEPGELRKVDGVGEASATLISFAGQLARRYMAEQAGEKTRSFHSSQEFQSYVAAQFIGKKNEIAYLFCLDNAGRLIHHCQVSLGTKYSVSLDNRTLLETAFHHNASSVVLAHNHPNGLCAPSTNDIELTKAAAKLYREVDIHLLDHLIVANGECFSMGAHRKYVGIFHSNVTPLERPQAADPT